MPKIYVAIASYRDPYLQGTIDSLFEGASFPHNIKVGCYIHALPHEMESSHLKRTYDGKVEYVIEPAGDVFSVTECRNRSLKWFNERYDYVLQIDSHSRFDKGWDERLLYLINSTENQKAILSGALPVFDILEDGSETRSSQAYPVSFAMHTDTTKENILHSYDLSPRGVILDVEEGKEYARDWYMTGHFIFASADYFRQVPQPDWVLFWGEEVYNGARTFTAGWDVYIPINIPIYHLYSDRMKRPRLHEDFPDQYFPRRDYTTDRIIDILSGKDVKEGDLFYERSMEDFYKVVGHNLGELFNGWRDWRNELMRGRQQ